MLTDKNKKNSAKLRLDELLVEKLLAADVREAQALIMAGKVFVDDKKIDKPGTAVKTSAKIDLKEKPFKWVSRGGLKLEAAIKNFALDVAGKICIDLGASTGGFTDVLLDSNAKKIYAVDVGFGQLAWKLQNHPQVIVLDKTNARYLTHKEIPEEIDVIVCDASFISLKTILPASFKLTAEHATLAALIKPQFEAKQREVGAGGIIRDEKIHNRVCEEIKNWLIDNGWKVEGICPSPITGMEGNKEFLIVAKK